MYRNTYFNQPCKLLPPSERIAIVYVINCSYQENTLNSSVGRCVENLAFFRHVVGPTANEFWAYCVFGGVCDVVDRHLPCTSDSLGAIPGGTHVQLGLSSPCLHPWVFLRILRFSSHTTTFYMCMSVLCRPSLLEDVYNWAPAC